MLSTVWQFFKIIISPTYVISCQHTEERNWYSKKLWNFIAVAQKLKEIKFKVTICFPTWISPSTQWWEVLSMR